METETIRTRILPSLICTKARKQTDGTWRLYYHGTQYEVFPYKVFSSSKEAKMYLIAQHVEQANIKCLL